MKLNTNFKTVMFMVLGFGLALTPMIALDLNFKNGNCIQSSDYKDDINLDNESLRISKVSNKIYVNGNSEWEVFKNAGLCTGSGTETDPYVIEDLVIDGGGSGSCILIENSDLHFIITNCTTYNAGGTWGYAGIRLIYVENGNVNQNNVSSNFVGIEVSDSRSIDISENNLTNNTNSGIFINHCSNFTILKNTINKNDEIGIYIEDSITLTMSENTVNENGWAGIHLGESNNNIISRNIVNYNIELGISISGEKNLISENTIINNSIGISLDELSKCNIISNNYFSGNGEDIQGNPEMCKDGNQSPLNFFPFVIGIVLVIASIMIITIILIIKRRLSKDEVRRYKKLKEMGSDKRKIGGKIKANKSRLPKDEVARYEKLKEMEQQGIPIQDEFPDEKES